MNGVQRWTPDYHPGHGIGMKRASEGHYYLAAEADKKHADAVAGLVAQVKELTADRDDLKDQLHRTEAEYTALLNKGAK